MALLRLSLMKRHPRCRTSQELRSQARNIGDVNFNRVIIGRFQWGEAYRGLRCDAEECRISVMTKLRFH